MFNGTGQPPRPRATEAEGDQLWRQWIPIHLPRPRGVLPKDYGIYLRSSIDQLSPLNVHLSYRSLERILHQNRFTIFSRLAYLRKTQPNSTLNGMPLPAAVAGHTDSTNLLLPPVTPNGPPIIADRFYPSQPVLAPGNAPVNMPAPQLQSHPGGGAIRQTRNPPRNNPYPVQPPIAAPNIPPRPYPAAVANRNPPLNNAVPTARFYQIPAPGGPAQHYLNSQVNPFGQPQIQPAPVLMTGVSAPQHPQQQAGQNPPPVPTIPAAIPQPILPASDLVRPASSIPPTAMAPQNPLNIQRQSQPPQQPTTVAPNHFPLAPAPAIGVNLANSFLNPPQAATFPPPATGQNVVDPSNANPVSPPQAPHGDPYGNANSPVYRSPQGGPLRTPEFLGTPDGHSAPGTESKSLNGKAAAKVSKPTDDLIYWEQSINKKLFDKNRTERHKMPQTRSFKPAA